MKTSNTHEVKRTVLQPTAPSFDASQHLGIHAPSVPPSTYTEMSKLTAPFWKWVYPCNPITRWVFPYI